MGRLSDLEEATVRWLWRFGQCEKGYAAIRRTQRYLDAAFKAQPVLAELKNYKALLKSRRNGAAITPKSRNGSRASWRGDLFCSAAQFDNERRLRRVRAEKNAG